MVLIINIFKNIEELIIFVCIWEPTSYIVNHQKCKIKYVLYMGQMITNLILVDI